MVEVAVADTGVGISEEDQKKLFTRFNQITTTQDGKPAGTGLGLYISRELTRKMGGELWIKSSQPGKGSVFVFSLPQPGTAAAKHAKETIDQGAVLQPDQK
jgi:signal transduction histidine kinase